MSQRRVLYQWTAMVRNHLAGLSLPQVKSLAAFSLGLGLAQRCALGAVSGKLSMLGRGETVERRLRRFISNPKPGVGGLLSNVEPLGAGQPEESGAVGAVGGRDQPAGAFESDGGGGSVPWESAAPGLAVLPSGKLAHGSSGADPEFAAVGGPGYTSGEGGVGGSGPWYRPTPPSCCKPSRPWAGITWFG